MRVKVGEKCKQCIYYSASDGGCNYNLITRRSRLFQNGQRIVDVGYCTKYTEGQRLEYSAKKWKNSGVNQR